ncbi:vesicle transport protein SFT2B-like [Halichondria panicea]|uniref:vesicle transport protein SFT2B-like n=1 Tax=Halichondria panicea TaxID=6063 RepID=UPI00312BBCE2
MSGILDSMKSAFSTSGEDESDTSGIFSNPRQSGLGLPKLSLKQRIIGFCISITIAAAFGILACLLVLIPGAGLTLFGIFFTISTIAGLFCTFFLVGPIEQAKKMYDPKNPIGMAVKIICAITLVLMFALAFCAVFWWNVQLLSLLFCIGEFVALVIYSITLIPFATTLIHRGVRSMT